MFLSIFKSKFRLIDRVNIAPGCPWSVCFCTSGKQISFIHDFFNISSIECCGAVLISHQLFVPANNHPLYWMTVLLSQFVQKQKSEIFRNILFQSCGDLSKCVQHKLLKPSYSLLSQICTFEKMWFFFFGMFRSSENNFLCLLIPVALGSRVGSCNSVFKALLS